MKPKSSEKWLGDFIHEEGVAALVAATVKGRSGRTTAAIFEIKSIVDDFRMQRIRGIVAAFELWEKAIIPSLLNNAETWTEISEECMEELEDLQFLFVRTIMETAKSTPKTSLLWETGLLPMRERISRRKLTFISHIRKSGNDTLVKKVFQEQQKNEWPGLIRECELLCNELEIPNISTHKEIILKKEIKSVTKEKAKNDIINEMTSSSKMKDKINEKYEMKEYFQNKVISEVRTMFSVRSGMFKCKMNYKNDRQFKRKLWFCGNCAIGAVDTLSHILVCEGFKSLREGKDISSDKDLVQYYQKVQTIREKSW